MIRKLYKRLLPIIICISLTISSLAACNRQRVSEDKSASTEITIDTEKIVEKTTATLLDEIDNRSKDDKVEDHVSSDEVVEIAEEVSLSTNWEDYIGDIETFVYGLLANELKYKYDVFPAYINLSNGLSVYGIGYTDYSECFTDTDGTYAAFKAGFLPYFGEIDIPEAEFNDGMELYNSEYQDEATGFVLAYESDAFTENCVVYGKYVKYGVDENGHIFYETQDYHEGLIDESIGSLYSYDEDKYLFDTDFGNYDSFYGEPISKQIDYNELSKAVNDILHEQDNNFVSIDVETYAYESQQAIDSYLLSMQKETFLGYDAEYLRSLTNSIDPQECYRITNEGIKVVKYDVNSKDATSLVKWIVGTGCIILIGVGIVGTMATTECPVLSAASGTIAGVGIEILMKVIESEDALTSIEWEKLVLAAATGAISGYLGPYLLATFDGMEYIAVDSIVDSILAGLEKSTAAWLDGEDGQQIIKQFGYGMALGFSLSAGFKGVGKTAEKLAKKAAPVVKHLNANVYGVIAKKSSKALDASNTIKITNKAKSTSLIAKVADLKKIADSSPFHSRYISNKLAWKQVNKLSSEELDDLAELSIGKLSQKEDLLDLNNNVISKNELRELFKKASDNEVIAQIKQDTDIISIIKKNNMVGIVFDKTKYQTVVLPSRLTTIREANFKEAALLYRESWVKVPSLMPASLKKTLADNNIELETIEPEDLKSLIQKSDFVMHENVDMTSITLVPRVLHDTDLGGIAHMGGVGLAKYLKNHIGMEYFDSFCTTASSIYATGTG